MGVRRGWACWVTLLLVVTGAPASWALQRRSAAADPTPVPDPNLAALGGLGGLSGLTGGGGGGGAGQGHCNNQDFLTNLLVYQYLSGGLPGGAAGSHPQLAALLGSQGPATTTVTRVSKTLTTLSVDVPPTTQFTTSTTSYVTTITSVESKVIPVIFRGSKITTTITESSEEVITATEYFTESSVLQPSIVQTLPVHITLTETKTRGLNGHYSVFDVTVGATSVVHEPVTTSTLDLDVGGLDLANLDLSQLDLTSLAGSLQGGGADADNQVLSALSSLLQNYDEQAGGDPFGPFATSPGGPSSGGGNNNSGNNGRNFRGPPARTRNFGGTRFSAPEDYADYEDPVVDETPKYNVLRGFTLSDRVAGATSGSAASTGRAATDTRYSKFHRKERVDNNGISTTESSPRESERYSASTRRRTLSRAGDQRRAAPKGSNGRAPSTRFVPAVESQYFEEETPSFRPFGQRRDREASIRRRGNLEDRGSSPPRSRSMPRPRVTTNSLPPIGGARQEDRSKAPASSPPETVPEPSPVGGGLSTVLTMYISGSEPGQFHTRVQTIYLRSLGSSRRRRNVNDLPMTKLSTSTTTTASPSSTRTPEPPPATDPQKIVKLLKNLDPKQVRQMLHSLQKWVDYYSNEVLDESENEILPELTSSLSVESSEVESSATTALPNSPSIISGIPRATDLCPAPPTFTTTVYRTIVVTSGADLGVTTV